jgi:putative salt-induced outer membrane protein YdiY
MKLMKTIFLCVLIAGILHSQEYKPFKISATLSYNGTGGNTHTHSLSLKGEVENNYKPVIVNYGGGYSFALHDCEKKSESMNLYGGVKVLLFKDRIYALYRTEWKRNRFAGIDNQFKNLGGAGVVIISDDRHNLSVEGGVNFIYEEYTANENEGEKSENFSALHLGSEYSLTLTDYARLKTTFAWDMNMEETEDQMLITDVGLNFSITNWLSLGVVEKLIYDNLPPVDYEKLDLETTVGLTLSNY